MLSQEELDYGINPRRFNEDQLHGAHPDEEPVHAPGGGEEQCTTILGGSRGRQSVTPNRWKIMAAPWSAPALKRTKNTACSRYNSVPLRIDEDGVIPYSGDVFDPGVAKNGP